LEYQVTIRKSALKQLSKLPLEIQQKFDILMDVLRVPNLMGARLRPAARPGAGVSGRPAGAFSRHIFQIWLLRLPWPRAARSASLFALIKLGTLSVKMGRIKASRISDWENNQRAVSKTAAKGLSKLFGVPADRFI
jgi:hypothetical protein